MERFCSNPLHFSVYASLFSFNMADTVAFSFAKKVYHEPIVTFAILWVFYYPSLCAISKSSLGNGSSSTEKSSSSIKTMQQGRISIRGCEEGLEGGIIVS